jgi:hypothetical protein
MKTRIIIFIAVSGIVTLSFTFTSIKSTKASSEAPAAVISSNEPVGGFTSEDKL